MGSWGGGDGGGSGGDPGPDLSAAPARRGDLAAYSVVVSRAHEAPADFDSDSEAVGPDMPPSLPGVGSESAAAGEAAAGEVRVGEAAVGEAVAGGSRRPWPRSGLDRSSEVIRRL